jgi:hypothetical protein
VRQDAAAEGEKTPLCTLLGFDGTLSEMLRSTGATHAPAVILNDMTKQVSTFDEIRDIPLQVNEDLIVFGGGTWPTKAFQ